MYDITPTPVLPQLHKTGLYEYINNVKTVLPIYPRLTVTKHSLKRSRYERKFFVSSKSKSATIYFIKNAHLGKLDFERAAARINVTSVQSVFDCSGRIWVTEFNVRCHRLTTGDH